MKRIAAYVWRYVTSATDPVRWKDANGNWLRSWQYCPLFDLFTISCRHYDDGQREIEWLAPWGQWYEYNMERGEDSE